MIVQGVGVGSTLIVLMQLAIAGAMPLPAFGVTTLAVVLGYILNILNYQKIVIPSIWQVWEEAVTIGGVTVLPQVWSGCLFTLWCFPSILNHLLILRSACIGQM